MTEEESEIIQKIKQLIEEIIDWNIDIKNKKPINNRVFRGRSPSFSNFFEDRFAIMLGKVLHSNYTIFIDYPISYRTDAHPTKKISYFDIMILKDYISNSKENNGILCGIIELKIDLGWLDNKWIKTKLDQINLLKNQAHEVGFKDNTTEQQDRKKLKVKKGFPWAVVLATNHNHYERFPAFKKELNSADIECFVLSNNIHIRADRDVNEISNNKENIENWEDLGKFINNNFKED
jgi:hypothetical protein